MYIGKGVLRACIITIILAFILAVVQTFTSIGEGVLSMSILITTMLSIIYGSIYATRKISSKGWIVGIMVALLYMAIIYIAAVVLGKDGFILKDLWRVLLALLTGTLSGMLGINL
jgi:putative membrane protein (TIGR04086 family)